MDGKELYELLDSCATNCKMKTIKVFSCDFEGTTVVSTNIFYKEVEFVGYQFYNTKNRFYKNSDGITLAEPLKTELLKVYKDLEGNLYARATHGSKFYDFVSAPYLYKTRMEAFIKETKRDIRNLFIKIKLRGIK